MTNEEIEAARKAIWDTVYHDGPGKVEKARNALDALCAAARQQESLVGRKVRVKESLGDIGFGNQMTISCGPLWLGESPKRAITLNRNDFELLEGDNAE